MGSLRCVSLLAAALLLPHTSAGATPRDQAKRIHDRLTGVPPTAAVLDRMVQQLVQGQGRQAALLAMENPAFYNTTLRNFVTPWTNAEQTIHAPLNDYTATVIGMIRDQVPFDQVLSADILYLGAAGVVDAPYSQTDNAHYEQLQERAADLSDPAVLVRSTQSEQPGTPLTPDAAAGVLTTRAAAAAFFEAGTNRRMLRFTALNFLCRDLEALSDISRPADRVRQDVTRSPGGDSSIFLNACVGCHSGMDALAGAYANYHFDPQSQRLVYTPDQVQPKFLINDATFPLGHITVDDSWSNYWRSGANASLGWDNSLPAVGNGMKSLGREVAASRAFAECQVQKVFRQVCFRLPGSAADWSAVDRIADEFARGDYAMKQVFADVAVFCMGE